MGLWTAIASSLLEHCFKGLTLSSMLEAKMLVTGTPGIGKTSWIIYVLWKLAEAGRTVILDLYKEVFLFSRQASHSYASSAPGAIRNLITQCCYCPK